MPTYISAAGLEKLKEEIVKRKRETRREIASRIEGAKELGDLSENFEYHEAKEQQALNETRIVDLDSMIKDSVIVEQQSGGSEISLGSTFVVMVNGGEKTYEMVGSSEADPISGKISNESPIGEAFMGHKKGDVVQIEVPSGTVSYTIERIN